jgi:hypothetical protein
LLMGRRQSNGGIVRIITGSVYIEPTDLEVKVS